MNLSSHEVPSSPAFLGSYSSAQALDAPLHRQVRSDLSSAWNEMDESWRIATEGISEEEMTQLANNPAYHEAWARNIPAPMFGSDLQDLQQGEHIDNMLQSVMLSDPPTTSRDTTIPIDIINLIDEEVSQEGRQGTHREDEAVMSAEQKEMHLALTALQNSDERADEKITPPDDNEAARTGVYAATPAEALQAIWNETTEGERASSHVRDSPHSSGGSVSRRIREILKRGSYVDDVYGVPPQLEKTIVQAEEEETEENKDRRQKAIRRLDALYRHLGAGSQPTSISDYVKEW
jgi:hypothetical protein